MKKTQNSQRFFYIQCCGCFVKLKNDDFTYDGKMDYFCHKHIQGQQVFYLTWRGGITEVKMKEICEINGQNEC